MVPPSAQYLEVKCSKESRIINCNDIMFIEAKNKQTIVYLKDQSIIETDHLLQWYQERLPPPDFCRSHRSYIVNFNHIDVVGKDHYALKGGIKVPVSNSKRNYSRECLKIFLEKSKKYSLAKKYLLLLKNFIHSQISRFTPNKRFCI